MELGPVIPFATSARSPEPRFEILHPDGASLRLFSAKVEQLFSGCQWAEGPVWFADQRSLIWSDIPMNRMLRWDETTGRVGVFRSPSMLGGPMTDFKSSAVRGGAIRCRLSSSWDGPPRP